METPAECRWLDHVKLWWPLGDPDPDRNFKFAKTRLTDVLLTLEHARGRKVCVQAGCWVGVWPMLFGAFFEQVYTFDVMRACVNAARANCAHLPHVKIHQCGLGECETTAKVRRHPTPGSWRVDPEGDELVRVVPIDSLRLDHCDAIVLDIEGYEVEALKGAASTIAKFRPVIHVEELPRSKAGIVAHMQELKYVDVVHVHSDVIYVPLEHYRKTR